MKAYITVVDDNGKIIYKDYLLEPTKEEIVGTSDNLLIKETSFNLITRQLVDFSKIGDKQ